MPETKVCKRCGSFEIYDATWNQCRNCLRRYRKALRRAKSDAIRDYKSRPCSDCGQQYPWYVMDFDHIIGDKKFNISASYCDYSWSAIIDEIRKCEVVCANCHRIRTAGRETMIRDEEDLSEFLGEWDFSLIGVEEIA